MARTRIARTWVARMLLLAGLGTLAGCQHAGSKAPVPVEPAPVAWQVDERVGQILVRAPAALDWRPLAPASELGGGYQVRTGAGAALILTRAANQIVSGANSRLELPESGTIVHRGGIVRYRAGSEMLVKAGGLAIRAGKAVFVVGARGTETAVAIESGEVVVQQPGQPAERLGAGQRLTFAHEARVAGARADTPALPVRTIDLAESMPATVLAARPRRPVSDAPPAAAIVPASTRAAEPAIAPDPPGLAPEPGSPAPFARLVEGLLAGVGEASLAKASGPAPAAGDATSRLHPSPAPASPTRPSSARLARVVGSSGSR